MSDEKNSEKALDTMSFEECFSELERLVTRFEEGKMSLSESISCFERGMKLIEKCSEQLSDAETKVEKLLKKVVPPGGANPENSDSKNR
jgi:exodeoxyribonuclease VII small subunit